MLHAFSVDVEDWYQSTYDAAAELSDRFQFTTFRILDALEERNVQGTFFVLGLSAEKAPHVVTEIARRGHIIQSHGYGHRSNFELDEPNFRKDVERAKKLLEDMTGNEVFGYRAPFFSVDESNWWVLDALAETGYLYDSSVFPLKTSRYGVGGYSPEPRVIRSARGYKLVEAPVACFHGLGYRFPCGGGGYFRLLPYWAIRRAWRQLEHVGRPGILYLHPYEYDVMEVDVYRHQVPLLNRLHQGIGRKAFPRKIDRLLTDFTFGSMEQVLRPLLNEVSPK
jgi:polysaccharide deacetylase family protein (PEP-CTERM system associated)